MGHHYTWDKLVKNAYRLNPKSRGQNYPYTPKWEYQTYTSGEDRGQKVIVPFKGTNSVLISLRAWGVTQASLHNVTLYFQDVDIQTEDPNSTDYFQIQYKGVMYWVHKLDKYRNPLTSRCTCFTGDTKVLLADGSVKTFEELEGQTDFEIISYNEKVDKFEIVKAYNCEKKQENAEILRITLDNGKTIDCTLDHRFLLRDGSWVEAQNLKEGDSLRALYMDKTNLSRLLPNGKKEKIHKHKAKQNFYVYVYLDPRYPGNYEYKTCSFNFKPIYIGKGIGNRCNDHLKDSSNDRFHNTVRKLIEEGTPPIILRQFVNLEEQVAFRFEKELTNEIGLEIEGKGPLLNCKHGGEGGASSISTLKTKIKNIENGCFEKLKTNMTNDNPMKNEDVVKRSRETLLFNTTEEQRKNTAYKASHSRTDDTFKKISESIRNSEKAQKALLENGKRVGIFVKRKVEEGSHHTQTSEWKEFCKQRQKQLKKELHDNTLNQLIEIIKKEGKINLDSYVYKKGYNYSVKALTKSYRQKYIQKEALEQALVNHKVVKIEKLSETKDVYCLTAEYLGNFIVDCSNGENIFSGVTVANCKDEFFTWAYYKYNAKCLYGPKPRPYIRKTTWMPPRNAHGLIGCCKHVHNAWAILRNSGFTMN